MENNNQYTEQQIRDRYTELYPYDDPITIWEIRDLNIGADLDHALTGVYNARLSVKNKNQAEKREKYWRPILGSLQRWQASLNNETNPIIGMERVIAPAVAMTAFLRNPIKVGGAMLGSSALALGANTLSEMFTGKDVPSHISDATGLTKYTSERVNPFAWIGGFGGQKEAGRLASKYLNKLFSKWNIPVLYTSAGLLRTGTLIGKTGVPSVIPFYFSLIPERYIPELHKQLYYQQPVELTPERIDAIELMKRNYSDVKKRGGNINYLNIF